jgi:glycosyltransferase involved in cell wall biosynthesis
MPRVGLIISTFNQREYLARVLAAVDRQSSLPDEVLLADDGSESETRQLFAKWSANQKARCQHVWQPHEGFRKAAILNEAVANARSEYFAFLDGDTLPHPRFVADHRRLARDGGFIQGHRALLKQGASAWFGTGDFRHERRRALLAAQLEGLGNAFRWPRPWLRPRRDLRGIRGCNLAMWRRDFVAVNGYNEAFVGWGREDSELAVRLANLGVRRFDARGWALCYHLWHLPASRDGLGANDQLLAEAQRNGITRCQKGLTGHLAATISGVDPGIRGPQS